MAKAGASLEKKLLGIRVSDISKEPLAARASVTGYEDLPIVPLETAVESLVYLLPDIVKLAHMAKEQCKRPPAHGMTIDESASIMLYSMGSKSSGKCLHEILNTALRSDDDDELKSCFFYLKLFLTALSKIPSQRKFIFRGVKSDLHDNYRKGGVVQWFGFSSCVANLDALQSDLSLGEGATGTVFTIECNSAKDITNYSINPNVEELLIMPGTSFTVMGSVRQGNTYMIQLKETKSSYPFLQTIFPNLPYTVTNDDPSRPLCGQGGECTLVGKDPVHTQEYRHPVFCNAAGECDNMNPTHLKTYRHLPLCPNGRECVEYNRQNPEHCQYVRHCIPPCRFGHCCVKFHNRKHMKSEGHPFCPPCPSTPFHCKQYNILCETKENRLLPVGVQNHCLTYSHVCRDGRQCKKASDTHWKTTIHIARNICPAGDQCDKINEDNHLASYTHIGIADIRPLCAFNAADCEDIKRLEHIKKYRHLVNLERDGVIRSFGRNTHIDFVSNQNKMVQSIKQHAKRITSQDILSIPLEIMKWIRGLQAVHRCSKLVFESILVHGHVMSRDHMEKLKRPAFVATAVSEHKHIRAILSQNKLPIVEENVKDYIRAIVSLRYKERAGADPSFKFGDFDECMETMLKKEKILTAVLRKEDVDTIKRYAHDIADASWNLANSPSGIGYANDKLLGTDKHVFAILGPHFGHNYGDIFLVFKSKVMHHPDANFSPQAATSFLSTRTFTHRPWVADPGKEDTRIKAFHESKLHCSTLGYEYPAAAELVAISGLSNNTMDVDVRKIIHRWKNIDSHEVFEAHLPELVPLDYIEDVYIPNSIFSSLSTKSQDAAKKIFGDALHITNHTIAAATAAGALPFEKTRKEYQEFVTHTLLEKFRYRKDHAKFWRGICITIAPSCFMDHIVLPLTIRSAREQFYRVYKRGSNDDDIYIYWEALPSDMMITICNEPFDMVKDQPNLQCFVCHIAERPPVDASVNYYESISYLNVGTPFRHGFYKTSGSSMASSGSFHLGCNLEDFLTFCLKIDVRNNQATLSHAGPNSIYCQETITCKLSKANIDLNNLQYIHVSAGSHTVSIQNLFVTFEQVRDLHPSYDMSFKYGDIPTTTKKQLPEVDSVKSSKMSDLRVEAPSPVPKSPAMKPRDSTHSKTLKPCWHSFTCQQQESPEHMREYSHPCPYGDLCTSKATEPYLTHESRHIEHCPHSSSCTELENPTHRARYRHLGYTDFLITCQHGMSCRNKTSDHRRKYSHVDDSTLAAYMYAYETGTTKTTKSDTK